MIATLEKEQVLFCIQGMPQRFTIDDVIERILLMTKVENGLDQIAQGNSYTQDEVEKISKEWFNNNSLTK
jgi:hypothetical protein